jgi:hypothetical protein
MSQIPRYAFRVIVLTRIKGQSDVHAEQHNFVNLAAAVAYREIALGRKQTRKTELLAVLDESTPNHPT